MARPLSSNSQKVLRQLGKAGKSADELAARTGIRRDRVAKLLWHLENLGWISVGEEVRRVAVYRSLREAPPAKRKSALGRSAAASHLVALQAVFGSRLPAKRARGRTVRQSEE
jgi:hypothetical protein